MLKNKSNNIDFNKKKISIKEMSNNCGISEDTIKNCIRRLMPNKMKNGVKTLLNEKEITIILDDIKNNNKVMEQLTYEAGSQVLKTNTSLTQDLKMFNIKNETKELDLQKQIQLSFSIQADIIQQLNKTNQLLEEKNKSLEIKLGLNEEYYSIKRVSMINKKSQKHYNWRMLKNKSFELGLEIKDEQDSNYGTVKSYHIRVWKSCYPNENYGDNNER